MLRAALGLVCCTRTIAQHLPLRLMIHSLCLLLLLGISLEIRGQTPVQSTLHRMTIRIGPQPIALEGGAVIPGSLQLVGVLPEVANAIDLALDSSATHLIIAAPDSLTGQSIRLAYRTLPFAPTAIRTPRELLDGYSPDSALLWLRGHDATAFAASPPTPPFTLTGYAQRQVGVGQSGASQPSGAIQLALQGTLPSGLGLEAQLTDQSLPFQPEGTTTEIQALDRLYIRVYDSLWAVAAGDLSLEGDHAPFLHYTGQTQGVGYRYGGPWGRADSLGLQASLGVAKGTYTRIAIAPMEGIQGPYRLQGERQFTQVVVLAGSERVYLDGKRLVRGQTQDYTIDYNLGEIRFTARNPITSHSNIVVEYEQISRHFTRYFATGGAGVKSRNGWLLAINGYTAQDARSVLSSLPDPKGVAEQLEQSNPDENGAYIVPTHPTLDGRTNAGYRPVDTLIDGEGIRFFRHCKPGEADSLYELVFTYVGPNAGDYISRQGAQNLQIFEWVAPRNGISQGDYRAGQRVAPPSSHTVLQASAQRQWGSILPGTTRIDVAYSYWNANTLARNTPPGRNGFGLALKHTNRLLAYGTGGLWLEASGRYVDRRFQEVEAIVPVDYYRQWGLVRPEKRHAWGEGQVALASRSASGVSRLEGGVLLLSNTLGSKLDLDQQHAWGRWHYESNISARAIKHNDTLHHLGHGSARLRYAFGPLWLSAFSRGEWGGHRGGAGGRAHGQGPWWQAGLQLALPDSLHSSLLVECSYRRDYAGPPAGAQGAPPAPPSAGQVDQQTLLARLVGSIQLPLEGQLDATASVRALLPSKYNRPKRIPLTILSDLQIAQPLWQQRLTLTAGHSLSAERVPRYQLHYIAVPLGEGQYTWLDANGDGIAQVEEFVVAAFADQGRYILQQVPSSEERNALAATLGLDIQLTPRPRQQPITDSTAWWQRLDLSLHGRSAQQRADNQWGYLHWPGRRPGDTALLAQRVVAEGRVIFNRAHSPLEVAFCSSYSYIQVGLSQGASSRQQLRHTLSIATPERPGWGGSAEGVYSAQSVAYPYGGRYHLQTTTLGGSATLLWRGAENLLHAVRFTPQWINERDGKHHAHLRRYSYQWQQPLAKHWRGNLELTYARVMSNFAESNPLAYEVLEGLRNGNNWVAEVAITWQITRYLEARGAYMARRNGQYPIAQAGFLQLRALF